MKRESKYLAALLPFSMAISSSMAFGAGNDQWDSEAARHKSKSLQEEEGGSEGQDGEGGKNSGDESDAKTPGNGPSGFDGDQAAGGAGGSGNSAVDSTIASVPHANNGMYAPSYDGPGGSSAPIVFGGGGGGGGGVATVTKTVFWSATPEDGPDGNEGYVVPDPADADAMLILLGGIAEAGGEGATSSGDIVFDIVDYGDITFGYGYATFMASGEAGSSADTFFHVSGADLVFSYSTGPSWGPSASSTTHVLAIDFEDESMFTEQQLASFDWMELLAEGPFAQNILGEEEDVSVDGNIALMNMSGEMSNDAGPMIASGVAYTFDSIGSVVSTSVYSQHASLSVAGEAEGFDSLASASGGLIEIEDQFSSVNGTTIGIA